MVAATTSAASSANDNQHTRRPRTPDRNDHLIFQWVKMEGKTQDWVATQLGISQATVSRVIQRYERWQAHANATRSCSPVACESLRKWKVSRMFPRAPFAVAIA